MNQSHEDLLRSMPTTRAPRPGRGAPSELFPVSGRHLPPGGEGSRTNVSSSAN